MDLAIKITNLYKEYRLGIVGTGTLYKDLQSFWAKIRNKEDPNSLIGVASNKILNKKKFLALNNINLEIKKGDVIGIIGRNGAGKSTLLKIISRITAPTSGSICYNGKLASLLEVGTGFHNELTGRENIYLNGAINGMSKIEVDAKLKQIIDFAGVEKFIDTPVKRYSSGMFVRLGFAVAAHLDPDILIVDEVLAVGDAEFRSKAIKKMEEQSKIAGRTVLFVSHNLESIKELCNKTILMADGKIIDFGKTEKIINSYLELSKNIDNHYSKERIWEKKSKPGNNIILLNSISTKDKNKVLKEQFDITEDVHIEINYQVLQESHPIAFSFVLSNNQNTIFASLDNHITQKWSEQPNHEKGNFITTCKIPGNLLNDGIHDVNLSCYSPPLNPDANPHFKILESISFQILDNFDLNSARGSFPYSWTTLPTVRPKLLWKKDKITL